VLPIDLRTAAVLTLCCSACRSTNPATHETATSPSHGGAETAGELLGTPYYQIRASSPEDCAPPEPALASTATHRVGVELTLEPTSDIQVPANPYYARLVDSEQNVHEATLGGCGEPLAPTLPTRGRPAHGWIVFELPRSARPATLLYAPELVGAPKSEIAIDLRR
jgi:hypothetical protein